MATLDYFTTEQAKLVERCSEFNFRGAEQSEQICWKVEEKERRREWKSGGGGE